MGRIPFYIRHNIHPNIHPKHPQTAFQQERKYMGKGCPTFQRLVLESFKGEPNIHHNIHPNIHPKHPQTAFQQERKYMGKVSNFSAPGLGELQGWTAPSPHQDFWFSSVHVIEPMPLCQCKKQRWLLGKPCWPCWHWETPTPLWFMGKSLVAMLHCQAESEASSSTSHDRVGFGSSSSSTGTAWCRSGTWNVESVGWCSGKKWCTSRVPCPWYSESGLGASYHVSKGPNGSSVTQCNIVQPLLSGLFWHQQVTWHQQDQQDQTTHSTVWKTAAPVASNDHWRWAPWWSVDMSWPRWRGLSAMHPLNWSKLIKFGAKPHLILSMSIHKYK